VRIGPGGQRLSHRSHTGERLYSQLFSW
jgi:hypothetical protein